MSASGRKCFFRNGIPAPVFDTGKVARLPAIHRLPVVPNMSLILSGGQKAMARRQFE